MFRSAFGGCCCAFSGTHWQARCGWLGAATAAFLPLTVPSGVSSSGQEARCLSAITSQVKEWLDQLHQTATASSSTGRGKLWLEPEAALSRFPKHERCSGLDQQAWARRKPSFWVLLRPRITRDAQIAVPDGAGDERLGCRACVENQLYILRGAVSFGNSEREFKILPR